ncbi:hypothetical protein ABZ131_20860 [Providencia rettgeri]
MSAKLSIQEAIVAAIAVADLETLGGLYSESNCVEEPKVTQYFDADDNQNVGNYGIDLAEEDTSRALTLTADDWHKKKGILQKLFSEKTIESVDGWLSMEMLNEVDELFVDIRRIHTSQDGNSDYVIVARRSLVYDADSRIVYETVNQNIFNELMGFSAQYHAALQNLTRKLSKSFFESDRTKTPVALKKFIPSVTSNIYSINMGDFDYSLKVSFRNEKYGRDLNSTALLSNGYAMGEPLKTTKLLTLETEQIPEIKPTVTQNKSVDAIGSNITIDGKLFEFGSF